MVGQQEVPTAGRWYPGGAASKLFFFYGVEPKRLLERFGIKLSQFHAEEPPTVYKFDLSKPDGIFLADTFKMRDHDLLVAAESPSTEFIKLMNPLSAASSNAFNISAAVVNSRVP